MEKHYRTELFAGKKSMFKYSQFNASDPGCCGSSGTCLGRVSSHHWFWDLFYIYYVSAVCFWLPVYLLTGKWDTKIYKRPYSYQSIKHKNSFTMEVHSIETINTKEIESIQWHSAPPSSKLLIRIQIVTERSRL